MTTPTPQELLAQIEWMEFARDSHLKWAEHLEAHAASGEACQECEERPYKLDAHNEREWVRRYDVVLSTLRALAAAPSAAQEQQELDIEDCLSRANEEIAKRERSEVAYSLSEQKRLVLLDKITTLESEISRLRGAAAPSAGAGAQEAALLSAFRAGFQWGIDGTDKYGEYNGGPVDDGFTQFLATHAATPAEPMPPPPPPDTLDREALTDAERNELDALLAHVCLPTFTERERQIAVFVARAALALLRTPTPTGETR